MSRIVVGVDASTESGRALQWALTEAKLRGVELEVVHAFTTPEVIALPAMVTLPSLDDMRQTAEAILDEALAGVDDEGVTITRTAQAGSAAGVLCEVARGAELLVVGARGLGGFRGLLAGSVSHQVVSHSPCPVVVVPPEDR